MAQGTVNIWKKYIYINSDIEGKVKNICEDIDSFCFFLSFFFLKLLVLLSKESVLRLDIQIIDLK